MENERKTVRRIIAVTFLFFLGFALFVNINGVQKNFLFADEATYFSMAQSFAHDGDMEYTRRDLYRYHRAVANIPQGLFLKKRADGRLFFAKSYIYPLVVSPFVRLFSINGPLVFHAFLLLLLFMMGTSLLNTANRPGLSLAVTGTFLLASTAIVYFVWMSPDFFNLFLIFSACFLWIYKHRRPAVSENTGKSSRFQKFLYSDYSDYAAALLAGIAFYSKPPNIAVLGPPLLYYLIRKKYLKPFIMVLVFAAAAFLLFGANQLVTGDWNYQGGERKTFYNHFPLADDSLTFDSTHAGEKMSSENYAERHLFPVKCVFYNIFYYFFGRFTGLTWYFFPAVLFLVLFIIRPRSLISWLIFAALAGEILIYIVMMPDDYAGAGGAVGNRYFLNIYPLFFFLPDLKHKLKEVGASWIAAGIFIAPLLLSPFAHSQWPYINPKGMPFKLLPVELTLINNIPVDANPDAFRQQIGHEPRHGWLHFMDDNFIPRRRSLNEAGFWTQGSGETEIILKTFYPVKELHFHLLNNPRLSNRATVKMGRQKQSVSFGYKQKGDLVFRNLKPLKIEWWHLYRIRIKADKGSIPFYEGEGSMERRNLGVYFEIEIVPEEE